MDSLTPIPSPPGHLWREFRHRALPVVVFAGCCVLAAYLWRLQGGGRTITALGEGITTTVVSPQPATLRKLLVEPYSRVTQGQPVALVEFFDPSADFEALRTSIDLARLRSTPTQSESHAVDLEQLRLDLFRTRSDLATARVRLDHAERDLARNKALFDQKLLSEDLYDLSRSTRDLHEAEVQQKQHTLSLMEARLQTLEDTSLARTGVLAADAIIERYAAQLPTLTNRAPLTLVAPASGTLGRFLRTPGEFVLEGEPLVVIQSDRADHLVGYLRQPFNFEPAAGLSVECRRRSAGRERFASEIIHVSAQYEIITNALALVRDGVLLDTGLPVVIGVPEGIHIRPGELVDVLIKRDRLFDPVAQLPLSEPL